MIEQTQNIMIEYLQVNYPIKRLRDGRRFKRGILFDNEMKSFLKPNDELKNTFTLLANELQYTFGVPRHEIDITVLKYLGLI